MDAGFFSSLRSSENKSSQTHSRRYHHPPRQYGDRFIPDRSSMDFALAHYLLVESKKEEEKKGGDHPFGEGYQKLLAETLMINRSRILVFNNKSHKPVRGVFQETLFDGVAAHQLKSSKPRRYIPKCADRTLDAPGLLEDYYLNLLDWSNSNVLAVALGNAVYLWNASVGASSELFTIDEETGPVTSISWAPSGQHIAVGMDSSIVEIWDVTANRKLRTLRDGHRLRVGSLSWNNQILTTGGKDSLIISNDVRIQSPIVQTYRGHHEEVCGLKWSNTEKQLASGGNDDLLYIWDKSMTSSNYSTQWLHKLDNHTAAVKALAWCPYQSNLLASGGGSGDGCIKFWNTHTGACLNSVDTDSQVCSLLWNKNERELLSSHGFGLTQNQLTLWKYPSMTKIAEFTEHTDRILFMAQSPDGCTVASAAADETLKFWSIFGAPGTAKPALKTKNMGPFTDLIRIR